MVEALAQGPRREVPGPATQETYSLAGACSVAGASTRSRWWADLLAPRLDVQKLSQPPPAADPPSR